MRASHQQTEQSDILLNLRYDLWDGNIISLSNRILTKTLNKSLHSNAYKYKTG